MLNFNRMESEISIVMPVFNGGKYLTETLESILKQSFRNYELVCINDASTDNSLEILKKYSGRINMQLIDLKENIGLVPLIIKTYGIPYSKGKYYMYMSQDDFLSSDCLENMYQTSIKCNADSVIPDFIFFTENNYVKKIIGLNGERDIILSGNEAFVYSLDWRISGAALWRIDLIKRVGYEVFNMYADEYTVRKCFLECEKVAFCKGEFFYRTDNPDAITRKMKPALFSKLFKEAKLLELVFMNAETKVFKVRFVNLVNMFFDYHQIFFEQDFDKIERTKTKVELKLAYLVFKNFLNRSTFSLKGYSIKFIFKLLILRLNYFCFYSFCRLKYSLNS